MFLFLFDFDILLLPSFVSDKVSKNEYKYIVDDGVKLCALFVLTAEKKIEHVKLSLFIKCLN